MSLALLSPENLKCKQVHECKFYNLNLILFMDTSIFFSPFRALHFKLFTLIRMRMETGRQVKSILPGQLSNYG